MRIILCSWLFLWNLCLADAPPNLARAIEYVHDQELEKAIRAFLTLLEAKPTPQSSVQMSPAEAQHYEVALQLYLNNTGRLAQRAAAEIRATYGPVLASHPDYHQLGYLLALSYANDCQYEAFFSRFYLSYLAYPDHYLAYKTRALLYLKLKERARDPLQMAEETRQMQFFAQEALQRNPRDISLMQMSIQFAPPEKKAERVATYLNNIVRDNIIVPRGDLLFFVKEAIDSGQRELAERFLVTARGWYASSRSIAAAEEYMRLQEELGTGERTNGASRAR